jgi:hypothetical protein
MASVGLTSFWIFRAGGVDTDAGSATWRLSTPGNGDTITWEVGPNTLDSRAFPLFAKTEGKFTVPPTGAPTGRVLAGVAITQAGPSGTTAVSTGTGTSGVVAGTLWGRNYKCDWNLALNVTPGAGAGVGYDTSFEADDPIYLDRSVFADNTAGRTSLYLPISLEGLDHAPNGGGGLSVSYVTDAGRMELLRLESSGAGSTATSDPASSARYYLIDDPNENPMARGVRPHGLDDLRDVLAMRMRGGLLNQRLMFGVLLENIAVPTVEIGAGGIVAEVHVASRLFERGDGDPGEQRKPRGQQVKR